MQEVWVFGYGSLMWEPGFAHDRAEVAVLDGYSRSFCMWSIHHRGTPDAPGLVLALDRDRDGRCEGLALRIRPGSEKEALDYLRERELISSAYREARLPVLLRSGQAVEAVTFVVDAEHEQYCRKLPLERQAQTIAQAHGGRGPNSAYLFNTCAHLSELGLHDPDLVWLEARVRQILGS